MSFHVGDTTRSCVASVAWGDLQDSRQHTRHYDVLSQRRAIYLYLLAATVIRVRRGFWGISHGGRSIDRYLWLVLVVWVAELALATCAGETQAELLWRADVSWEINAVTRLLGPQASHRGPGNTVVTVFPRRSHSLACVMAAGRVQVMHRESVLHP